MKIDISVLKDGDSLVLEHEYDPKELGLELYDLHYLNPLRLNGRLERVKTSLFLKGSLSARIEILCTRCLKPLEQKVSETLDLYFPVLDDQEFLDATDEVREVVLLSYPVKFLCSEGCKGLCPRCGANLNEEKCACAPEKSSEGGAFDQLKDWYKKRGKNG